MGVEVSQLVRDMLAGLESVRSESTVRYIWLTENELHSSSKQGSIYSFRSDRLVDLPESLPVSIAVDGSNIDGVVYSQDGYRVTIAFSVSKVIFNDRVCCTLHYGRLLESLRNRLRELIKSQALNSSPILDQLFIKISSFARTGVEVKDHDEFIGETVDRPVSVICGGNFDQLMNIVNALTDTQSGKILIVSQSNIQTERILSNIKDKFTTETGSSGVVYDTGPVFPISDKTNRASNLLDILEKKRADFVRSRRVLASEKESYEFLRRRLSADLDRFIRKRELQYKDRKLSKNILKVTEEIEQLKQETAKSLTRLIRVQDRLNSRVLRSIFLFPVRVVLKVLFLYLKNRQKLIAEELADREMQHIELLKDREEVVASYAKLAAVRINGTEDSVGREIEGLRRVISEIVLEIGEVDQKINNSREEILSRAKVVVMTTATAINSDRLFRLCFDTVIITQVDKIPLPELLYLSSLASKNLVIIGTLTVSTLFSSMVGVKMGYKAILGGNIFAHLGIYDIASAKRRSGVLVLEELPRQDSGAVALYG